MTERINFVKRFKSMEDEVLLELNRFEMPYERHEIATGTTYASQLVIDLYHKKFRNLNYEPFKIGTINENLILIVSLVQQA